MYYLYKTEEFHLIFKGLEIRAGNGTEKINRIKRGVACWGIGRLEMEREGVHCKMHAF